MEKQPQPWELMLPQDIRGLRRDLKMSQPEFARAIGLASKTGYYPSVTTIVRWENGTTQVGPLYGPGLAKLYERMYDKPAPERGPVAV